MLFSLGDGETSTEPAGFDWSNMTRLTLILPGLLLLWATFANADPFELRRVGNALHITFSDITASVAVTSAIKAFIDERARPEIRSQGQRIVYEGLRATHIEIDNFFDLFVPRNADELLDELRTYVLEDIVVEPEEGIINAATRIITYFTAGALARLGRLFGNNVDTQPPALAWRPPQANFLEDGILGDVNRREHLRARAKKFAVAGACVGMGVVSSAWYCEMGGPPFPLLPRWTPETHVIFPPGFRRMVRTLITIHYVGQTGRENRQPSELARLPRVVLLHVLIPWVLIARDRLHFGPDSPWRK